MNQPNLFATMSNFSYLIVHTIIVFKMPVVMGYVTQLGLSVNQLILFRVKLSQTGKPGTYFNYDECKR